MKIHNFFAVFNFSTLRDGISCTSSIACVMLAGVMTWVEGSSVVGNLTEVGYVHQVPICQFIFSFL